MELKQWVVTWSTSELARREARHEEAVERRGSGVGETDKPPTTGYFEVIEARFMWTEGGALLFGAMKGYPLRGIGPGAWAEVCLHKPQETPAEDPAE